MPLSALVDRARAAVAGEIDHIEIEGPKEFQDLAARFDDALQQKRAVESRLKQSEKLEAVGRLAGGVAHDFNNLLTVIRGHAELLDEVDGRDASQKASVDKIIESADMASNLTRELLTFSRQDLQEPQAIVLDDVVRKVDRILVRVIPSDIEVELRLGAEDVAIEIDPVHAEQILLNLALNARDAMDDGGGTLTITTGVGHPPPTVLDQRPDCTHGFVHLAVSDTGTGISPETVDRLFEPYFTTKGMGSGLGLATVHGVVEGAGGVIEVQSAAGTGTTFHVYLPVTERKPEPGAEGGVVSPTAKGSETVVVAEDNHQVRDLLTHILERQGYKVIAETDGEAALSAIKSLDRPIDLLVTDVMMPGMKGPDLADQVRALHPAVPVLYTSGYAADSKVNSRVGGPRTAFLQKPFRQADLLRAVQQLLHNTPPSESSEG